MLEGLLESFDSRDDGICDSSSLRELRDEVGWETCFQLILEDRAADGYTEALSNTIIVSRLHFDETR